MSGASQKHAGDWPMAAPPSERYCFSDFDRRSSGASLFGRPGMFVGLSKGMAESDSSGSPKSPLDCRMRSPRSPIWNRDKVGLSLISEGECRSSRIVFGSSGSRNTLFMSRRRIGISSPKASVDRQLQTSFAASSKSLPSNYAVSFRSPIDSPCIPSDPSNKAAELPVSRTASPLSAGEMDSTVASGSLPITGGFANSISATEIERSEDYTRIISRGPNPKTTHIFGDCVFEDPSDLATNDQAEEERESIWMVDSSEDHLPFPADNFLGTCFCCKKKLEGEDIYIYRGEKAFCSQACRSREIWLDGEAEEPPPSPPLPKETAAPGDEIAS